MPYTNGQLIGKCHSMIRNVESLNLEAKVVDPHTRPTTYLGVIMQSDQHMALKKGSFENSGSNQAHSKASPTRRPVTGLH